MKMSNLHVEQADLHEALLPRLRKSIFHVTGPDSLKSILEAGQIDTNKNGRFSYSFPQSKNSYGRKRGFVCLFDLRNVTDEELEHTLSCYYFLRPSNSADRPAFLLYDAVHAGELIPNSQPKSEGVRGEMWIPYSECWYPGHLPLNRISECICVDITHNKPMHVYSPDELERIDQASKLALELFQKRIASMNGLQK